MKGRKKVIAICCLFLAGLLGLCGCSSPSSDSAKDRISDELVYESSMELEYAKQFSVDYNLAFASYLLALLPILIFYLICQKHILNGVVNGAVK